VHDRQSEAGAGGRIEVASGPGGTTFSIRLPAAAEEVARAAAGVSSAALRHAAGSARRPAQDSAKSAKL
jgi:hypothetical protein